MLTGLELTFMGVTPLTLVFSALQVLLSHLWEKEKGGKKERGKKKKMGRREKGNRKGEKEGRGEEGIKKDRRQDRREF